SNFLLDGVSNNNYLITGPLNPVAPEAIQEYRISTNNYSAQYGRTNGFVANAVTRAGSNSYHLNAYWYIKNEALNAADFADNAIGAAHAKDMEHRFGYQAGGPIVHNRLFFSSSLEQFNSHGTLAPANAPPELTPSPSGLTFDKDETAPMIMVYSTSATPAAYQASASTTDGGNWLKITPTIGTASSSVPGVASVSVNTNGLAPGVYTGSVSVA